MITSENWFSKICMEGFDVEECICMRLHFLSSKVFAPLSQPWKDCSWVPAEPETRAVIRFSISCCSQMWLSIQVNSGPLVRGVEQEPPAAEILRGPGCKGEITHFLWKFKYLSILSLQVATPILAINLFPGMTGRHVGTFPCHSDFTEHASKLLCPLPPPIDQQGADLENVKCSFMAKLCKWHAYI